MCSACLRVWRLSYVVDSCNVVGTDTKLMCLVHKITVLHSIAIETSSMTFVGVEPSKTTIATDHEFINNGTLNKNN